MDENDNMQSSSVLSNDSIHRFSLRDYYEDMDATGIVYHATYLNFAERARSELLRFCGINQAETYSQSGLAYVVRRCNVDYLASAHFDDLLEIRTKFTSGDGAQINLMQIIHLPSNSPHRERSLVHLALKVVSINQKGQAVRIPAKARARFEELKLIEFR